MQFLTLFPTNIVEICLLFYSVQLGLEKAASRLGRPFSKSNVNIEKPPQNLPVAGLSFYFYYTTSKIFCNKNPSPDGEGFSYTRMNLL